MFLLRLIRFLCGYVKIRVTGRFPERFLNICANRGINLWYSHRRTDSIECCMFARDYKKIRAIRRGCAVKVNILKKYGLPFYFHRYRRRKGLLVGAAVFAAFLFIMPNFVWSITVNTQGGISETQVFDALSEIGLEIGTPMSRVDTGNMRVQLALAIEEISWVSINTDASTVTVDIRQATQKEEKDEKYSNMISAYDGIVSQVYVRNGNAVVNVGDAVVKGQMLVSGTMEYNDGRTVFCHSDADIIARTERTVKVSVPFEQTVTVDTGRVCRRRVISVFGITAPLYVGEIDYTYRAQAEKVELEIGSVILPAWTAYADFYEVAQRKITVSRQAAEKQCIEKIEQIEKSEFADRQIISRSIEYVESNGKLEAVASYVCSENIAQTSYFNIYEQ